MQCYVCLRVIRRLRRSLTVGLADRLVGWLVGSLARRPASPVPLRCWAKANQRSAFVRLGQAGRRRESTQKVGGAGGRAPGRRRVAMTTTLFGDNLQQCPVSGRSGSSSNTRDICGPSSPTVLLSLRLQQRPGKPTGKQARRQADRPPRWLASNPFRRPQCPLSPALPPPPSMPTPPPLSPSEGTDR